MEPWVNQIGGNGGQVCATGKDGADAGGSYASLFKIAPDIRPILASESFAGRLAMDVNLLQVFVNGTQLPAKLQPRSLEHGSRLYGTRLGEHLSTKFDG